MKRLLVLTLLLAACREETAAIPGPVPMTEEAVGHYCQMELLEHPGPKAQVHLEGRPGMPLFFSQVRDGIAYFRLPEQSDVILAIYVNDMAKAASWEQPGSENWIPAASAIYVVGSSRQGGMGAPELVPFSDEAVAKTFAAEHGGRLARLEEIPDADVIAPVALEGDIGEGDDGDYEQRLRALSQRQEG